MISLVSYTILMPLIFFIPVSAVPALFMFVGFMFGLGAGPIVGLPSSFLPANARAIAMGVYYTIYYVVMMIAPALAGIAADAKGSAGVTIIIGAALLIISILLLGLLRKAISPSPQTAP